MSQTSDFFKRLSFKFLIILVELPGFTRVQFYCLVYNYIYINIDINVFINGCRYLALPKLRSLCEK